MKKFDICIIGGGPGGYVAAIKAAQLGKKVVCVEKRERLGGTCLNVGCIPSKALLHSSHKYEDANKHFESHGISVKGLSVSIDKMMKRKENVINDLGLGIAGLFKKNKVEHLIGTGSFAGGKEVVITDEKGKKETISADNIIIATGSDVMSLPGIEIDEKTVISSTGALSLNSVPKKMVVIGAGVIGLELGSVWSRLGSEVTVVEFADKVAATMDSDVSKEMKKILEKQGLKFELSAKVTEVKKDKKGAKVVFESLKDAKSQTIDCDIVLVAVGRRPYTDNLGLDKVGITVDERGKVPVDSKFKTSADGVYAIGDVIDGPMLAHKAEEEGVCVVETLAGQHGHINYKTIPSVVYTDPEVASVGITEDEAKAQKIDYKVGKFPFMANSRARAAGETDGFVKIIACKKTDEILGADIVGPCAGELIGELCVGMEFRAAAEDIARTCHSHPGFSEAIKEAALGTFFKPIHM